MGKHKDFKENEEIKEALNIESKLDIPNVIDQLPLSSTVKINNPAEEIKITIDNITNVGESKAEILPEVVEELNKAEPIEEKVTINVLGKKEEKRNTLSDLKEEFSKNGAVKTLESMVDDLRKDFSKISIVDISKKKSEKNHSSNPVKSAIDKAVAMSPVSIDDIEEKAFDSLIYLGGSFIAATSLASKTFASVGSAFINKK